MKFLVDAHLPPGLCAVLERGGQVAIHTSALAAKNRTTDAAINQLSVEQQFVVITKDSDFYHSHLLTGKPWKLLLIRTGNIRTRDLRSLFERHLAEVISALETNSLVELDHLQVQVVKQAR